MISKAPVLDLFIGRDGDAWRLYVAARSWKPMLLADRMETIVEKRGVSIALSAIAGTSASHLRNSTPVDPRRRV